MRAIRAMRAAFWMTYVLQVICQRPLQLPEYWHALGAEALKASLSRKPNDGRAKNIIFCMGDGMSISTVTAMRIYKGEVNGKAGDMSDMFFETFPNMGLLKVYNTDETIADSAATATAFMSGIRTKSYLVNVDDRSELNGCKNHSPSAETTPITKLAKQAGMSVGVVTTSRVTHATPATAFANTVNRWWEDDASTPKSARGKCPDIASQLIDRGRHLDVILGGGRAKLLSKNDTDPEHPNKRGKRLDGRNLIEEWLADRKRSGRKCSFVYEQSSFDRLNPNNTDCVLGLFEYDHLGYELERKHDVAGEPSLTEMTEKAIRMLSKNEKGFFLLLEGGRIDHGHHDNHGKYAITEGLEFERAIQKAVEITNPAETLVIVTADHGHSMNIVGYSKRGRPLFGLSDRVATDGLPYTTILYASGKSYNRSHPLGRKNITDVNTEDVAYKQEATIPTDLAQHTGEDVAIYATGPQAHLIHKLHEQTYVHTLMAYAACLDQGHGQYIPAKHCERNFSNASIELSFPLFFTALVATLLSFI